jgi:energy-coupling factor transporter ATP-binding protein EcfA2
MVMIEIKYKGIRKSSNQKFGWEQEVLSPEDKDKASVKKLEERVRGFEDGKLRNRFKLRLEDNSILLFVGPNGSGKSTLLQQLYLSLIGKYGSAVRSPSGETRQICSRELEFLDIAPSRIRAGDMQTMFGQLDMVSYDDVRLLGISSGESIPIHYNPYEHYATKVFTFSDDSCYVPFYFDAGLMGVPPSVNTTNYSFGAPIGYKYYASPLSHRMWHEAILLAYTKTSHFY